MRNLCVGLVLALLLSACGGQDPEGEKLIDQLEKSGPAAKKQACFAKVTVIVERMSGNVDTFIAATDQATTAEQFAAGMQALAAGIRAGWADLQKLNDELNAVGATADEANALITVPLADAIDRRDVALEKGCEKWAETDVVQAALQALMEADEQ